MDTHLPPLEEIELNCLTDDTEKKCKDFDEILEDVGNDGKYQKNFLYVVVGSFMFFMPIFSLNKLFMLSIPAHTCHVEGRPNDTDLDTWKNMTIPKEIGPDGNQRFSQCKMFSLEGATIACDKWDYDKTEYESTIATEFNWVCQKSHYVTNVFTAALVGNVFGSVIFGRAADRWGRKPVLIFTLAMYVSLQIVNLFIPQHYMAYLILHGLSESAYPFLFVTPMLLAAEISGKDFRSWIYSFVWIIYVGGDCSLPILSMLLRNWFTIGIVTTPMGALVFFIYLMKLPESPRWLMGMGRLDEAEAIIQDIARVNGRSVDLVELRANLMAIVEKEKEELEETTSLVRGALEIFKKKRLARNTILLCLTGAVNRVIYDGVLYNASSMSGNEFLTFFLLALIELPAGYIAGILVEKSGRRWTCVAFFLVSAIAFLVSIFTVFHHHLSWLVLMGVVTAKFGVSISSFVSYLQAAELYPTPLRSTGNGVANLASSVIGMGTPYAVFLGTINASAPYILLGLLCVVGAVGGAYLPETLNLNLPATIEEANDFGKDHKFWSFLPHKRVERQKDDKIGENNRQL